MWSSLQIKLKKAFGKVNWILIAFIMAISHMMYFQESWMYIWDTGVYFVDTHIFKQFKL